MNLGFRYLDANFIAPELFDCGEPELNSFLRESAAHFVKQGLSAIRLLIDLDNNRLVGFYAISPLCVELSRLSAKQREQYNVPFPIPSWLIGRLAIDKQYQKLHLGGALLLDAMKNIRKRAENGAGALIIVDAKNRRIKQFYKKYGFSTLDSCGGLKLAAPVVPAE